MSKNRKILITVISVIAGIVITTAIINAILFKSNMKRISEYSKVGSDSSIVPTLDENGDWEIVSDRELKIMNISDIHIGGGWMSYSEDRKAINAIAAMVSEEKPDLIIVTGDMAFPVPFISGTLNNRLGESLVISLFEQLGVYWAPVLGNHDSELYSYYSREAIADLYTDETNKYCLFLTGPEEVDGTGNYVINVKNSNDVITQSLILLDSHSYTNHDYFGILFKYDNIHENQVVWYESKIKQLQKNNPDIKSMMFMHIPLVEMNDAVNLIASDSNNSDVTVFNGSINERICCGEGEDSLFERILELGSTQALFFGHDHKNNMSLNYKGISMTYSASIDYLAYSGIDKLGDWRGCLIITLNPDGSFSEINENYYQDKYKPLYPKEEVSFESQ